MMLLRATALMPSGTVTIGRQGIIEKGGRPNLTDTMELTALI